MSAQPSPRSRPAPNATPRPGVPSRGDGARARLTVAPDRARRRLRARLLMWGAALFTVASLFTLVAFHVFEAQSAFTLERLSKERANEQLRNQRLRQMVASESSAAVVIAASNKDGMVPAPSPITLTVSPAQHASSGPQIVTPAPSATDWSKTKQALEPYEP
jgi:hypothetical protein